MTVFHIFGIVSLLRKYIIDIDEQLPLIDNIILSVKYTAL
jgi:hypothetical protein